MQTKEKLRTGMMTLADGEDVQNRKVKQPVEEQWWCMAIPNPGMKPYEGFTLNAGKKTATLLVWYSLDRGDLSSFRSECSSKRCTLVQLPSGVRPKDLEVEA